MRFADDFEHYGNLDAGTARRKLNAGTANFD